MKTTLFAVSAMALLMQGTVMAEAEKPVIDQRTETQAQQKIDKGTMSGQKEQDVKQSEKQGNQVSKMDDKEKFDAAMKDEGWSSVGPPQNRTARFNARIHARQKNIAQSSQPK